MYKPCSQAGLSRGWDPANANEKTCVVGDPEVHEARDSTSIDRTHCGKRSSTKYFARSSIPGSIMLTAVANTRRWAFEMKP